MEILESESSGVRDNYNMADLVHSINRMDL